MRKARAKRDWLEKAIRKKRRLMTDRSHPRLPHDITRQGLRRLERKARAARLEWRRAIEMLEMLNPRPDRELQALKRSTRAAYPATRKKKNTPQPAVDNHLKGADSGQHTARGGAASCGLQSADGGAASRGQKTADSDAATMRCPQVSTRLITTAIYLFPAGMLGGMWSMPPQNLRGQAWCVVSILMWGATWLLATDWQEQGDHDKMQ